MTLIMLWCALSASGHCLTQPHPLHLCNDSLTRLQDALLVSFELCDFGLLWTLPVAASLTNIYLLIERATCLMCLISTRDSLMIFILTYPMPQFFYVVLCLYAWLTLLYSDILTPSPRLTHNSSAQSLYNSFRPPTAPHLPLSVLAVVQSLCLVLVLCM